jgi:hypothetical protein
VIPSNMRLTRSLVAPRPTRLGWRVHSSLNVSTRVLAAFRTCATRVTPCPAHLIISRSSAGVARRSAGVAYHKGVLEPIEGFGIVQAQHDAAIVRSIFIYVVDGLSDHDPDPNPNPDPDPNPSP